MSAVLEGARRSRYAGSDDRERSRATGRSRIDPAFDGTREPGGGE
ncbi:hypothetical protein [Natrialbaceae archaeon AArc-T1-2]|nr:hypothetical protein [Natrialbaceae archaeon AArc-T1-2]WIV66621.1 hypothetical protein QQ977_13105 [Natrialbaceae archaeon AArc-T1-2]